MKGIILTGDRPTGPLHIGHYLGSLQNRVRLQDEYKQYVLVADVQALTDNYDRPEKVRQNVLEVVADYLAVGIDPKKSVICLQSQIPELFEMSTYFLNLVSVSRLERNPTIRSEIQQKKFNNVSTGFLAYPVSQAADILGFNADLVPIGGDQKPMLEQTNEIVDKFNRIYNSSTFKNVKSLLGDVDRLPGIDGKAKMSKSLGNAIFLSDSEGAVKKKVQKMYTDPNHLRIEEPGKVEGNTVFTFLDAFDADKAALTEMKQHYRRGGLGDGTVKQKLNLVLNEFLQPIRDRRLDAEKDSEQLQQILRVGTEKARVLVSEQLLKMKKVMQIDYFY